MKPLRETALEFLGVKNNTPENITAMLDKYEKLLSEKIVNRRAYKIFKANNAEILALLKGGDIKEHLKDSGEIIVFAATVGTAVDELIRNTEALDMAGAVVLDALSSAAVENICDNLETELKQKYHKLTTRFSPGYGDFPLTTNIGLLTAIDAEKQIGVYANKDGLMFPRKSVAAIIGIN